MSLVNDLRAFKESTMSAEDMERYLRLQFMLNPNLFAAVDDYSERKPTEGSKRGRKPAAAKEPTPEPVNV